MFIHEEPICDRKALNDKVSPDDKLFILQSLSGGSLQSGSTQVHGCTSTSSLVKSGRGGFPRRSSTEMVIASAAGRGAGTRTSAAPT